jgi:hypothetical protein
MIHRPFGKLGFPNEDGPKFGNLFGCNGSVLALQSSYRRKRLEDALNTHHTFDIDGRPAFVLLCEERATTSAASRLRPYLASLLHADGTPLVGDGSSIASRPSTPEEAASFFTIALASRCADRVDAEDLIDGYPLFLIDCEDRQLPGEDINTGLARRQPVATGSNRYLALNDAGDRL